MENGIKMFFVSKWFLDFVEYIDSKITIWPSDDISLIYLCWVTYNNISILKLKFRKNTFLLNIYMWRDQVKGVKLTNRPTKSTGPWDCQSQKKIDPPENVQN